HGEIFRNDLSPPQVHWSSPYMCSRSLLCAEVPNGQLPIDGNAEAGLGLENTDDERRQCAFGNTESFRRVVLGLHPESSFPAAETEPDSPQLEQLNLILRVGDSQFDEKCPFARRQLQLEALGSSRQGPTLGRQERCWRLGRLELNPPNIES